MPSLFKNQDQVDNITLGMSCVSVAATILSAVQIFEMGGGNKSTRTAALVLSLLSIAGVILQFLEPEPAPEPRLAM